MAERKRKLKAVPKGSEHSPSPAVDKTLGFKIGLNDLPSSKSDVDTLSDTWEISTHTLDVKQGIWVDVPILE